MKHNYFSLWLTALLMLVCQSLSAHDFEVDGIYYRYLSYEDKTVSVTYKGEYSESYRDDYSGNVIIPESVTYEGTTYSVTCVNYYAFANCTDLTSIVIPSSVTRIGSSAFSGCSSLESIILPFVGSKPCSPSDDFQDPLGYIFGEKSYPGGMSIVQYYRYGAGTTGTYCIPSSLKSVKITGGSYIPYGAFSNCSGLTSIEIPDSVTNIDDHAFYKCTNLTGIAIPNVTYLGRAAFFYCTNLTSIDIQSVTYIGIDAFRNCSSLTGIEIPSVTYIGSGAFYNCSSLMEDIKIPNGVTRISYEAFYNCSSLTSIDISNSVTSIERDAFFGCSSLTSMKIPNSVISIGKRAFEGCTGTVSVNCDIGDAENSTEGWFYDSKFSEVILGDAVKKVGKYAFDNCTGLKSIYSNAVNPPACRSNAFHEDTKWDCPLYVPKGSIDAYKAATGWRDFLTIQENPNYSSLESLTATDYREAPLYDFQGTQVVTPRQNGLYIRNGKVVLLK